MWHTEDLTSLTSQQASVQRQWLDAHSQKEKDSRLQDSRGNAQGTWTIKAESS